MDGRLTNAELAQRVGLSAAPCWRRVRALEESGYITGYHATLDRHKLGLGVLAFVRVDAAQNTADITLRMEEAIRLLPEVTSCHYISGAGTFFEIAGCYKRYHCPLSRTIYLGKPPQAKACMS
jgi:DNA-binding Lrp family transcriptional regulator